METSGVWQLVISEEGARVISAAKVLREVINLPLTQVPRLRKQIPGPVLTGTRTEMEWLRYRLEEKHIEAAITRA